MSNLVGLAALLIVDIADVVGLTNGRVAEPGEFPSVVRINHHDNPKSVETSRVSTGVLVTTTQVLTTCDSVGFFTHDRVKRFNVSKVTVRGGGVTKFSGIKKNPTSSRVHPRCFLLTSGIVLFNFGIYEFDKPFTDGFNNENLLRPMKTVFENGKEMGRALQSMWEDFEDERETSVDCYSAGWGRPIRVYEGNGEPDYFQAVSSTLQVTRMTVVGYDHCMNTTCQYFKDCLISIWEYGFVCAQAAKSGGPCRSDKGAPLICDGQIFAIHTNPQACSDKAIPRHFLRIDLAFNFVFGIDGSSKPRLSSLVAVITVTVGIMK